MIKIYTDGSAHPNPGPGGWGMIVIKDGKLEDCQSFQTNQTTNNKMELLSILTAFKKYGVKSSDWEDIPTIYSDSSYAINTFSSWMFGWQQNGWIKSDKRFPENLDIIKQYYDLITKGYKINLEYVKGHANNEFNELADKLARGLILTSDVWALYSDKTNL